MTVEVRPLGDLCNLKCTYCYEEHVREARNVSGRYNMDRIMRKLKEVGQEFHIFGGEAFLVPREDRLTLWEYGFKEFGQNGIQTNATLITEQDIEDMLKYNVSVGVSIDGPFDMNDLRETRTGGKEATREATQKTMSNIRAMQSAGLNVGIIICLHRLNGTKEALPRLLNFMQWLDDLGIRYGNMHTLEVEETMPDKHNVLTQEENIYAFKVLADYFEERPHLRYKPFTDVKKMMVDYNDDKTDCNWNWCDPQNTAGVYGIEGDGSLSNCGRAYKDGINWHKTDRFSYLRYMALYNTPEENGGCKDCRFFLLCGGQCPGEAINNDWRNKSTYCDTYKSIMTQYEEMALKEGKVPISRSPKLKEIEELMFREMMQGRQPSLTQLVEEVELRPKIIQLEVRG